jgi:hypothetical protein
VPEYAADPALLGSAGAADITASAQAPRRS